MNSKNKLIEDAREIYSKLGDSESKELFCDRILFALTRNGRYVLNTIFPILQECLLKALSSFPLEKEIIIYGTGFYSDLIFDICSERNVICFCDNECDKQKNGYRGKKVISSTELLDFYLDVVIIMSDEIGAEDMVTVLRQFLGEGNVVWLYELLRILEKEQYFPEDIISLNQEIFVDGGSYDFETSKILLGKCTPEKIYAFEPDSANCSKIRAELEANDCGEVELYQAGLWNEKAELSFAAQGNAGSQIIENGNVKIDTVSLDDVVPGKVTFIKMDIEGAELQALEGAGELIRNYKPKLAICIYHKLEDVLTIPRFIQSLVPEYRFYIRQHSFLVDADRGAVDAVLYAVIE